VPEPHLERIFDRFFTYRPVSGRGDHLGLGLAIVRRILDGYAGTISAGNRDGGGAVFEVDLPSASPADRRQRDAGISAPTGAIDVIRRAAP
jgi:signal transduction histidine kinase